MARHITIEDAGQHLADYIESIHRTGESLVVTKQGEPVAEIRPAKRVSTVKDFLAFLAEGPHLTPQEAEDFARDIEEARKLTNLPPRDPWAS